jgi:uncharacterized protein with ParB-like and HNH nuclease domain
MKAKESRLLDFLRASNQFVIPIYQRPYRWEENQCKKLWDGNCSPRPGERVPGSFG